MGIATIVAAMDRQYIKERELNCIGYGQDDITSILAYIKQTWYKILMNKVTVVRENFYTHCLEHQHITKIVWGLNKQQKRFKDDFTYEIPNSKKVRFFVEECF